MFSTFDRYLLKRYLWIYAILFVSTFGMFVVIDGFTNVDAFQHDREGALPVLVNMAGYYVFQASLFLDLIGSILSVISVMAVFGLMYRHSEIQPLLAAGVPTRRLAVPVVAGTLIVSALLALNQELIIPRISHHLQGSRSDGHSARQKVQPVFDLTCLIHIDGDELSLSDRLLEGARFLLTDRQVAREMRLLNAPQATFHPRSVGRPAGWHLRDVSPTFAEVRGILTPEGEKRVLPMEKPEDLFVVTDVSFDQLYNRSTSYTFVSTPELVRRIRNPAIELVSVRRQIMHLHSRLTRPLANAIVVLVAIPLIVRRESRSLVGNLARCTGALACLFVFSQLCNYLGSATGRRRFAAWAPLILSGVLGAWLTGVMQT